MGSEVFHSVGSRYDHQVVLRNIVAMLVEHKTPLPCQAEQVHTSVAQLTGVHSVEVGGIMKFYLHIVDVFGKDTHYFVLERTFRAKSENCGAFCETQLLKNHRTFASS